MITTDDIDAEIISAAVQPVLRFRGSNSQGRQFFVDVERFDKFRRITRHTKTWRGMGVRQEVTFALDWETASPVDSDMDIQTLVDRYNSTPVPEMKLAYWTLLSVLERYEEKVHQLSANMITLANQGLVEVEPDQTEPFYVVRLTTAGVRLLEDGK